MKRRLSVFIPLGLIATLAACAAAPDAPRKDCAVRFDTLRQELAATGLDPMASREKFPPSRFIRTFPNREDPNKVLAGKDGHAHTIADLDSMRRHMIAAKETCASGNEHAAMLHMDVVRALHKLPAIQHPDEHFSTDRTK